MTKQGSAMLVANFISESGLDHTNCLGDNGTACGLGQWRGGRQEGMPSDFKAQLRWAVEVEMSRDAGGHRLKKLLFNTSAGTDDLYAGLQEWERWGVAGDRYSLGHQLLEKIK